jgi:YHS domain-containing protein
MDHATMPMGMPAADAAEQAVDPVCGLSVNAKLAPQATHEGRPYSFCSEQHRDLFQKHPAKYLPKGK